MPQRFFRVFRVNYFHPFSPFSSLTHLHLISVSVSLHFPSLPFASLLFSSLLFSSLLSLFTSLLSSPWSSVVSVVSLFCADVVLFSVLCCRCFCRRRSCCCSCFLLSSAAGGSCVFLRGCLSFLGNFSLFLLTFSVTQAVAE